MTFLAFLCATVLAIVITLLRCLEWRVLDAVIAVYISFIRGAPSLIQNFLVYYVLPVVGIDIGAITAPVLALMLNSAAVHIETFRDGLAARRETARQDGGTPCGRRLTSAPRACRLSPPPSAS